MGWGARAGAIGVCLQAGCSLLVDTSGLSGGPSRPDVTEAGARSEPSVVSDAGGSVGDGEGATPDGAASSRYVAAVLADGPIMYWRLGDRTGAGVAEPVRGPAAAYSATGVHCGGAGAIAGDPDTACSFDGAAGRLNLATTLPTNAVSLELWARPRTVDGQVRFLASYSSAATQGDGLQLYFRDQFTIFSRTSGNATAYANTTAGPSVGSFQHFVATFDDATVRLYIDGVERASGTGAGTIAVDNGALAFADSAVSQFFKFDGDLDEIAVYDKALPAARVSAHFAVGIGR